MASPHEDWSTIWQSEMNALAGDREPMEAWAAAVALWAAWLQSAASVLPPHDGGTRPQPPARPASAVAASDDGAADRARLAGRVAELEQRLAELERKPDRG